MFLEFAAVCVDYFALVDGRYVPQNRNYSHCLAG